MLSGFYLNELLLKLTIRHDPNPGLFDAYQAALLALMDGGPQEPALRGFELRLLRELGYGLDLTQTVTGGPVTAQGYYHFRPADGLFATTAEHSGALLAARCCIWPAVACVSPGSWQMPARYCRWLWSIVLKAGRLPRGQSHGPAWELRWFRLRLCMNIEGLAFES